MVTVPGTGQPTHQKTGLGAQRQLLDALHNVAAQGIAMHNGNAGRGAAAFEILNLRFRGIRAEHAKTPVLEIAGEYESQTRRRVLGGLGSSRRF